MNRLAKRPLFCFTVSLIIGIMFGKLFPDIMLGIILTAVALIAALILSPRLVGALLVGAAVGFLSVSVRLVPPDTLVGNYGFTGTITDAQSSTTALNLMIDGITAIGEEGEMLPISGKLRLSLWDTDPPMSYGEMIGREITVNAATWRLPRVQRNPGGYDEALYLARHGVYHAATGNIANVSIGTRAQTPYGATVLIRDKLEEALNTLLGAGNAALLKSLILGFKNDLPEDMLESFNYCGIIHLMAVSGLHINLFVSWIVLLLTTLQVRPKLRFFIVIPALVLYCGITGLEASAIRAALMSAIMMLASMLERKNDPFTTLAASALIILIFSPLSLFDVGFQLSYCAIIGIYVVSARINRSVPHYRLRILRYFISMVSLSVGAILGVLPLLCYHFNLVSLVTILVELAAIPLTEIIMPLGTVFSLLRAIPALSDVASLLEPPLNFLLDLLAKTANFGAQFPWSAVIVASPPLYVIAAYYAVMLAWGVVVDRAWRFSAAAIVLTAAIAVCGYIFRFQGVEVVVVDVGQGDGIAITTPEASYAIDTGPSNHVAGYLMYKGLRLEGLFLSHLHADHSGGLADMLMNVPVKEIFIPENTKPDFSDADEAVREALLKAKAVDIPITPLKSGDTIDLGGGAALSVLYPPLNLDAKSQNELSMVMRLDYGSSSMLFTGDIEAEGESALLSSSADLSVDILKLAHHGSNTSSTHEFLQAVSPKIATASAGLNNRYNHPSPNVLERLESYDIILFRTDLRGAITLQLKDDGEFSVYTHISAQ